MATRQSFPEEALDPNNVGRDPRRTMRAPFPQRASERHRVESLTDRVRKELTSDRRTSSRLAAGRPAGLDA